MALFGKPLDRQQISAGDLTNQRQAGPACLVVDHHGARAANSLATPVFSYGQSQIGAKNPQRASARYRYQG